MSTVARTAGTVGKSKRPRRMSSMYYMKANTALIALEQLPQFFSDTWKHVSYKVGV